MAERRNGKRAVTMRDVARLAGVSQGTVSRVLSQTSTAIPISDETRDKVMEAVRKLGYHPNMTARSLRTQRTQMIAIMIADISNPFYHSIVRAVQAVAREHKYDVLIADTDHNYDNELHFFDAMMRRPVDGMIMVPYHVTADDVDRIIERTGVPISALARHLHHPLLDVLLVEDGPAVFDAITWLIQHKGHRRVGFIGVSHSYPPGLRRWHAYVHALEEAGLPLDMNQVQEGDWSIQSGERAMQALLDGPKRPTAVFACNDLMAIGALNAILDRGLRVPGDVALVGFDNIPESTYVRPRLTTIAQHPIEMGRQLAEALFDRIEGRYSGDGRLFELPVTWIEREST